MVATPIGKKWKQYVSIVSIYAPSGRAYPEVNGNSDSEEIQ
jgi:hypothetical protein